MNWNSYDTKYIIKRLIIYLLIAFAMFIIGSWKAKALTQSNYINSERYNVDQVYFTLGGSYTYYPRNKNGTKHTPFNNLGNVEGNLIFTVAYTPNDTTGQAPPYEVSIAADGLYICDSGNQTTYWNNTEQIYVITYNCPVKFNSNGLQNIRFLRRDGLNANKTIQAIPSTLATFISKNDVNVNVNQQQVAQAISDSQQATINAISNASNQAHQDAQQAHQDSQDIKDTITNDNITSSDADDFNNNEAFTDSTGLESVINLPLNMVNSLSNECQPIHVHIPYLETDATIPCMSTIYRSKFNSLYTLVKLVVNGFLVYRILLKVYELVHEAKQPDEDKLEVIEL